MAARENGTETVQAVSFRYVHEGRPPAVIWLSHTNREAGGYVCFDSRGMVSGWHGSWCVVGVYLIMKFNCCGDIDNLGTVHMVWSESANVWCAYTHPVTMRALTTHQYGEPEQGNLALDNGTDPDDEHAHHLVSMPPILEGIASNNDEDDDDQDEGVDLSDDGVDLLDDDDDLSDEWSDYDEGTIGDGWFEWYVQSGWVPMYPGPVWQSHHNAYEPPSDSD